MHIKSGAFLFIHAFSGRDSTSCFFGQGKMKIVSTIQKNPDLERKTAVFRNTTSTPDEIVEAGERITVALYGGNPDSQNREELLKAAAKTSFNVVRLAITRDATRLHSLRTYHQV
ncbi:hypothetical protein PPYR_02606 [Photinus pyralis]|uniref:Uncharacterized protein n=1 Tax=Photinus pyralis TaxID=7054 RepID=A0A5N4B7T8_PHOPY|nr:hypothetical protein PPYR_02606 [Photinus pyralis]